MRDHGDRVIEALVTRMILLKIRESHLMPSALSGNTHKKKAIVRRYQ
jgi:hypothetical protein